MFEDNIAFALMADNASTFSQPVPLAVKLSYGLPYASYHESRVNWRPLFFAKFFQLVVGTTSTQEAMAHLVAPNVFLNWTSNIWDSHPAGRSSSSRAMCIALQGCGATVLRVCSRRCAPPQQLVVVGRPFFLAAVISAPRPL